MLTLEQVEQFNARGYTVCPGFLAAEQVDALLAETARATEGHTLAKHDAERMEMEPGQAPEGTAVRRLYEPCSYYDVFEQLSEGETLLDCVEHLTLIADDWLQNFPSFPFLHLVEYTGNSYFRRVRVKVEHTILVGKGQHGFGR